LKKLIAILLLTIFTSACAHQAAFITEPTGARVMIDGEFVGVTPCQFDYKNSAGEDYEITVTKDGYDTVHQAIKADEVDHEARNKLLTAGLMIPGGSALMVGALFTKRLKQNYEFILRKTAPQLTAQTASPEKLPL